MDVESALRALLGDDRVHTHPLDLHLFSKDAGLRRGGPAIVVFPETTQEVAAIVRIAARTETPVVARGAGTGLAGGAVPHQGSIVLVTTRMREIWSVDIEGRSAWVGPGVINLDLSRSLAEHGVHFAPDPSSQQACTVGGNVATNAGGPHCLAEGTTVAHVLAVEMVDARGDVLTVGSESPDQPGLDLRAVVVGSEGTLGVVTRILVKLTPNPPDVRTLLLGFDSISGAAATVSGVIADGLVPAALEMMDRPMTKAVESFVGAGYPTDAAAVLLAEVVGLPAAVDAEAAVISSVAADNGATSIRVAADAGERELLWRGRKSAFGAVAQVAPDYYLHDTVVPRTRLVEVMEKVYEIGARHGIKMLNVFHAGDGNLHPLVSFDASEPGATEQVEAAAREMVEVSIAAGGALSGEHGIGSEKRDLMGLVFDPDDLDAQARLREAFDPKCLMNPGKVLPEGSRCFDAGPSSAESAPA